jgi:hypothetical protein
MNTLLQLLKLDSMLSPGLLEAEFQSLFRKCRFCGMIVTRGAQRYHGCPLPRTTIIDLTLDDDVHQHTIIDLTDD